MPKVTVTKKGPVTIKVQIDGTNLSFAGNTATPTLAAGEHALQWFVRGAPGQSYTVAITKPKQAEFSHDGTLDTAQKDAGLIWFTVT
jgi:hypothetical protein